MVMDPSQRKVTKDIFYNGYMKIFSDRIYLSNSVGPGPRPVCQYTFTSFVGPKLLFSQQFKIVGVGQSFSHLLGGNGRCTYKTTWYF